MPRTFWSAASVVSRERSGLAVSLSFVLVGLLLVALAGVVARPLIVVLRLLVDDGRVLDGCLLDGSFFDPAGSAGRVRLRPPRRCRPARPVLRAPRPPVRGWRPAQGFRRRSPPDPPTVRMTATTPAAMPIGRMPGRRRRSRPSADVRSDARVGGGRTAVRSVSARASPPAAARSAGSAGTGGIRRAPGIGTVSSVRANAAASVGSASAVIRTSSAVGRAPGSVAVMRSMSVRQASGRSAGISGAEVRRAVSAAIPSAPSNARFPVRDSSSRRPNEYTSAGGAGGAPWACSGAR